MVNFGDASIVPVTAFPFFIQLKILFCGNSGLYYFQYVYDGRKHLPEYQRSCDLLSITLGHLWSVLQLFLFERIELDVTQEVVKGLEQFHGQAT